MTPLLAFKILMPFIGAALYRWRGSALWNPPRPIVQLLIAMPFAVLFYPHLIPAAVALALTTFTLCLGHARWQDYANLHYLDDFLGMMYSGFIITLPAGFLLLNPFVALSGAGKALCYAISWKVVKGTWLAECLFGALLWGVASFLI